MLKIIPSIRIQFVHVEEIEQNTWQANISVGGLSSPQAPVILHVINVKVILLRRIQDRGAPLPLLKKIFNCVCKIFTA